MANELLHNFKEFILASLAAFVVMFIIDCAFNMTTPFKDFSFPLLWVLAIALLIGLAFAYARKKTGRFNKK